MVGQVSLSVLRRRDAAVDGFRHQHAAYGPSIRSPHTIPLPVAPTQRAP